MKNNGISRLPWYQSQFAMKQTEIAGWVCTVEVGKMKPWAWVPWEGYAQGLVGHSREDEKKKYERSGSRGLHLLPSCGDYHWVGPEGLLRGFPLELPVARRGSGRRNGSRGPFEDPILLEISSSRGPCSAGKQQ